MKCCHVDIDKMPMESVNALEVLISHLFNDFQASTWERSVQCLGQLCSGSHMQQKFCSTKKPQEAQWKLTVKTRAVSSVWQVMWREVDLPWTLLWIKRLYLSCCWVPPCSTTTCCHCKNQNIPGLQFNYTYTSATEVNTIKGPVA